MFKRGPDMPGDSPETPIGPNDASISQIPNGEEAWKLLDVVYDGTSTPQQRQRLEQLAIASPAIARLCLRAGHLWYGLQLHNRHSQVADEVGLEHLERTEGAVDGGGLNETMILPALREAEGIKPGDRDPLLDALPSDAPPQWVYVPEPRTRWPWAVAAAAGLALAVTGLSIWALRPAAPTIAINPNARPSTLQSNGVDPPSRPPVASTQPARPDAVISALAAAEFETGSADPGSPLSSGKIVALTRGAAELTFDSGATVVVTAPARFQVVGRNALVLDSGSVAAHVPPPAVGFRVQAPGLAVVDQGTNFGVKTSDGQSSETAVFDGKVQAIATNTDRQAVAIPVQLTAGQAVRNDAETAGRPEVIAFNPSQYNRDVSKVRVPLRLPASGEGVVPGEIDSNWRIISSPRNATGKPRPVYAVSKTAKFARSYQKAAPGRVWISPDAETADVPVGVYVYQTTIDLTGFDPQGVQLAAHIFADNEVTEFRVNGSKMWTALSADPLSVGYDLDFSQFHLKSGPNSIEIFVRNTAPADQPVSPTGISVTWNGSAYGLVRR
jgi:hypothetical protein